MKQILSCSQQTSERGDVLVEKQKDLELKLRFVHVCVDEENVFVLQIVEISWGKIQEHDLR